jgi:NADPH:quinone reductase-like Zn-dependent oxidoreductase
MRVLRFERFGPPSLLQLVDVRAPNPAPDEALVAVHAAAINPSDVKNVAGAFAQTKPPRTPGRDFAGVVIAGPPEWLGAAAWGTGGELGFTRDGTHAEAVLIPVRALRRKPERLSFAQAAAVGTPFVTAQLGLLRAAVAKDETVLVMGAAGSVGGAAVQIAAWRRASVVGLVQRDADVDRVHALGAAKVIVAHDKDAVQAIRDIDLAFDTTGQLLAFAVHALRVNGRVVAIAAPADGNVTFNLRELYRRNARIIGVDSLKAKAVAAAALLDELAPGFETGALQPPQVSERPLGDAIAAYQEGAGKIVLVPDAPEA